jgi:hypothetical protein
MSAILRREARNSSSPVLLHPVPQIARHSGVQAARPASKNVDAVVAIHRMPQEWTQPSRETAMREDDPSAFLSLPLPCPCLALSFALFFTLSSRTASCADALRDLLFAWLSSSPFSFRCHPERGAFCRRGTCCSLLPLPAPVFTLSSRARRFLPTRDLLFAFAFARSCLCVVIPSEALFADEGPAVRFCLCPLLSLRCHPERGAFCRRGTCCSLLPLPTSSPPSSFQITQKAFWKFPAFTSASPIIPAPLCG